MKTSRTQFASEILMREGPEGRGAQSQGVMALMGYSGGDPSKGTAFNSSRSWIKSGLELFRMDSIGRAFLGAFWCPGHCSTHSPSRERSGVWEMGASSSKKEGQGEASTAGMAVSPKLAISVTPRWDYGTFPTELPAAASIGSPRGGIQESHSTTVALPTQSHWEQLWLCLSGSSPL